MKNNNKRAAIILMLLLLAGVAVASAGAQSRLSVELDHPVYAVIESAELKGALPRLSSVKPYTRDEVLGFLQAMRGQPGLFSAAERAQIEALVREFSALEPSLLKMSGKKAALGIALDVESRVDAPAVADALGVTNFGAYSGDATDLWHLQTLIQPYVRLYPEPWLSLWGSIGITYDKINRDLYLPYSFTKEWDSYHNKVSTSPYSDGAEDFPTWSFDLRNDIVARSDSGSLMLRLSRFRRDWGVGSGSLVLSETARPFMGLEAKIRPSEMVSISHLVGSLGDRTKGDNPNVENPDAVTEQKMVAIQRLELFPFEWLTLSASGSMIGSKRFELGYLSPMMFAVEYQVMQSDVDNMSLHGDMQILLKRLGKLYASVYIDEMELSGFDEWFSKARNMFAYQGGIKIDVPGLPFSVLTAQYTKIEPFVYTHPPTWNSDTRLRVNTNYTNDGENLGYHLKPNSDEFLMSFDTRFAPGWMGSIAYRFIRHGDDPRDYVSTNHYIYGDVDEPLDYGPGGVADYIKNFLHDGTYDYNHLAEIKLAWRPRETPELFGGSIPVEFNLGYLISYTWEEDGLGIDSSLAAPEWKNILQVGCKVFF